VAHVNDDDEELTKLARALVALMIFAREMGLYVEVGPVGNMTREEFLANAAKNAAKKSTGNQGIPDIPEPDKSPE
jgi:hypothetical protein